MPAETLHPNGVVSQEGWSETPTAAEVDEDVDSPGGDWIDPADNETDATIFLSLPTPSGTLIGNLQVRAYVRKTEAGGKNPDVHRGRIGGR